MFSEGRPIFVQLAQRLADDVIRGRYAEGEQVPSTNELAAFMRINPATAGKALNELVDQGVLEKRRGLGMFVTMGAVAHLKKERQRAFLEAYVQPLLKEMQVLNMSEQELFELIRNERTRYEHRDFSPQPDPRTR